MPRKTFGDKKKRMKRLKGLPVTVWHQETTKQSIDRSLNKFFKK